MTMELKAEELMRLIQVCSAENVDSIQIGNIQIAFKGGKRALKAAGIAPESPLGQIAQEVIAFDAWNQDLPPELQAQINNLPVDKQ